jgi:hypothetical protein
MAGFDRHGLTNVAYFSPADSPSEVWFLLAHPSVAAAPAAYERLHAEPADIEFKKREKSTHGAVSATPLSTVRCQCTGSVHRASAAAVSVAVAV